MKTSLSKRKDSFFWALLNHKNGRAERSSATLDNGPVEELIGIPGLTLQGDFHFIVMKQNFLVTRSHATREKKADSVEFIQTHLYELFFGLLVAGVCNLVSDVLHKVYLPLLLLRLKIRISTQNYYNTER